MYQNDVVVVSITVPSGSGGGSTPTPPPPPTPDQLSPPGQPGDNLTTPTGDILNDQ